MNGDIKQEVGFNIRRIREERGLSQEELGLWLVSTEPTLGKSSGAKKTSA